MKVVITKTGRMFHLPPDVGQCFIEAGLATVFVPPPVVLPDPDMSWKVVSLVDGMLALEGYCPRCKERPHIAFDQKVLPEIKETPRGPVETFKTISPMEQAQQLRGRSWFHCGINQPIDEDAVKRFIKMLEGDSERAQLLRRRG